MDDLIFLFTGYGQEFTLGPLYFHLIEHGYHAEKIDFLTDPLAFEKLSALKTKKVVYLTSSHLLFDEETRSWYNWKKSPGLSPIEIIYLLNPIFSVYYPHDLQRHVQEGEATYLGLFDLILAPDSAMKKYPFIENFQEVGYIRFTQEFETSVSKPLFLASSIMKHFGNGIDNFSKLYQPILKQSIVKFPHCVYAPQFEASFAKKNIAYYPAEENSIELMQKHEVIIGQACSSTIYEAALLGKKAIHLTDPELDWKDLKTLYQGFDNVTFTTVEEFHKLDLTKLPSGNKTLKPFNMKQALNAIFEGINLSERDGAAGAPRG